MANELVQIEEVLAMASTYLNTEDIEKIKKAYFLATTLHNGQLRKSGEAYIFHPIAVARLLALWKTGPNTICAGLLHDVLEDCEVDRETIEKEFGGEVLFLVEAVTKLENFQKTKGNEINYENHRKLLIAMSSDVRAVLIKLADRMHNMRTLSSLRVEKQKIIAKETLEVFAPIAAKLGLYAVSQELNELSFMYSEPELYKEINDKRTEMINDMQKYSREIVSIIRDVSANANVKVSVTAREKSVYSIYRKLYIKGGSWERIFDFYAVKVIVPTKEDCYKILGLIHESFKPVPGRFKDYIALPKTNLYQSLHTTVAYNNIPFEVQIRTSMMEDVAENGIAAHWRYKEGKDYDHKKEMEEIEEKLSWFKDLTQYEQWKNKDYIQAIKRDVFETSVYVITPKNDVIHMPYGATALDFAFKLHTKIGDKMSSAIVNGKEVGLDYRLKNGDVIKILTSEDSKPSYDWLRIAKTSLAKEKIGKILRDLENKSKTEKREQGKVLLEKKLHENGFVLSDINFKSVNKKSDGKYITWDDIYEDFFDEKVTVQDLVAMSMQKAKIIPFIKKKLENRGSSIICPSHPDAQIDLSNCCKPIFGDRIVGIFNKKRVKVHLDKCPNVKFLKGLIDVEWDKTKKLPTYDCSIRIEAEYSETYLDDLLKLLVSSSIKVINISVSKDEKKYTQVIDITLKVSDGEELQRLRYLIGNTEKTKVVKRLIA